MKNIVCIRHGKALHNVMFDTIGPEAYVKYYDTPLVEEGIKQSNELRDTWGDKCDADLIIVSPCKRTLDTAMNIFKNYSGTMVALDCVMEYPQGFENCNKRKTVEYLKKMYPKIKFDYIKNNEPVWKEEYEFLSELKDRIQSFKDFVHTRKEKNIVLVSHSSFLKCMMGLDIGDESNELTHCHPYNVSV